MSFYQFGPPTAEDGARAFNGHGGLLATTLFPDPKGGNWVCEDGGYCVGPRGQVAMLFDPMTVRTGQPEISLTTSGWSEEFTKSFAWNMRTNYDVLTSAPGEVGRRVVGFGTAYFVSRNLQRIGPLRAAYETARQIFKPCPAPALLIQYLWGSAAEVMAVNVAVVSAGLLVGVTVGSAVDASFNATFSVVNRGLAAARSP